MFGVTISTRIPRTSDYQTVQPGKSTIELIANVSIEVMNNRQKPVYLKWKI